MQGARPIIQVFDGQHRELIIPVYQRNYDWQRKHCAQLFDDLEEIIREGREAHFFGAIVGGGTSFEWLVIDGQQRLTTVSILMLALAKAIENGDIRADDQSLGVKIVDSFLMIGDQRQEVRFKLKPVKDDKKAYDALFGEPSGYVAASNLTANFKYFQDRLRVTEYKADEIWGAVEKLQVMLLELDKDDDPQRIFESLNSTGLDLTEADKVRNFILMGHAPKVQEKLYEDLWNPIEMNAKFRTSAFIRWYLTTKNSRTPREKDVYEEFKRFTQRQGAETKEVLEELYEFSRYYKEIQESSTEFAQADRILRRMQPILGGVTLPFLMPVLRDVHAGRITEDDFCDVLRITESFIARRFIIEMATNALNKIFATAYSEITKLRKEDDRFADVYAYVLRRRTGNGRIPTDSEVQAALETRNMYSIKAQWRNYIYDVLENGNSRDTRDIAQNLESGDISIEHIMPQTLSKEWKTTLGPDAERIHSEWLHRIGNLTVTGYNSSYSNKPFAVKKATDKGFDSSPYRLNRRLKEATTWGEAEIQQRTEDIVTAALDYWRMPTTTFTPPQTVLPTEVMGDSGEFTGRWIVGFQYQDLSKTVESWVDMVVALLQHLLRDHRSELLALSNDAALLHTEFDPAHLPNGRRVVDDSLAVDVGNSTSAKMGLLRFIFDRLDLDTNDLEFRLKPTEQDAADEPEKPVAKYAGLLKYVVELDEAAELQSPLEDTVALRAQFTEEFAKYAPATPDAEVARLALAEITEQVPTETATELQALSVIQKIIQATQLVDPTTLHAAVIDGTLAQWVRRLEAF
ncbi:DUF262 domain-containing protein [Corynebacterium imitans]|uniref:DUF262 domain-containing protein n=1 Tax=Corynebacterium imitans TaxID=156978 RepID=UPI00254F8E59|nr:DUF262 domain-containing protein [Corynebacterium imitans]MDK8306751.1 DUF262 domain-containing protein [Corynebacterium imitans]MDK8638132.1 DUF262 domain-containing protein [Corynebacterium imitans]MDK8773226.1 DUF262 domain-containing protein [Corynebacterium imitans]